MPNLESVVEWYASLVADGRRRRRTSSDFSLRAEAAVYKFLLDQGLRPTLHESESAGGADFECWYPERFSVEVTAISVETFDRKATSVPQATTKHRALVRVIRSRISRKGSSRQSTSYEGPRILAIVSEHPEARDRFLAAIEEVVCGEWSLAKNLDENGEMVGEWFQVTNFTNAAHVRSAGGGDVEVFRPRHALTLFFAIHLNGADVFSLENPEPDYELESVAFASVPTVRLAWPVEDAVSVEWTRGNRFLEYTFQHIAA